MVHGVLIIDGNGQTKPASKNDRRSLTEVLAWAIARV